MPELRSARNSAEPTAEAKIALKPQERRWVKDRMAEIGATHLSPFLATCSSTTFYTRRARVSTPYLLRSERLSALGI